MSEEKPIAPNNPYFMTPSAYGYGVPMRQSLFTAAAWGGAAAFAVLALAWAGVPIPEPLKLAVIVGGFVFFAAVLYVWPRYLRRWMGIIEIITGRDLNLDGQIGEPEAPAEPPVVRVKMTENEGRIGHDIDLPVTEKQLKELSVGLVINGKSLAVAAWTGTGMPFQRSEFEALKGEMLRRGLIVPVNPSQPKDGFTPTRKGLALFRHMAGVTVGRQTPLPPTPMNTGRVQGV